MKVNMATEEIDYHAREMEEEEKSSKMRLVIAIIVVVIVFGFILMAFKEQIFGANKEVSEGEGSTNKPKKTKEQQVKKGKGKE